MRVQSHPRKAITSSFDTSFIARRATDPTTPPTRDANDARALNSVVDLFIDDDITDDDASTCDETFSSKQSLLRSPKQHQSKRRQTARANHRGPPRARRVGVDVCVDGERDWRGRSGAGGRWVHVDKGWRDVSRRSRGKRARSVRWGRRRDSLLRSRAS